MKKIFVIKIKRIKKILSENFTSENFRSENFENENSNKKKILKHIIKNFAGLESHSP